MRWFTRSAPIEIVAGSPGIIGPDAVPDAVS